VAVLRPGRCRSGLPRPFVAFERRFCLGLFLGVLGVVEGVVNHLTVDLDYERAGVALLERLRAASSSSLIAFAPDLQLHRLLSMSLDKDIRLLTCEPGGAEHYAEAA
jgi:hypothetical protein